MKGLVRVEARSQACMEKTECFRVARVFEVAGNKTGEVAGTEL